jgi:hypothetical protein
MHTKMVAHRSSSNVTEIASVLRALGRSQPIIGAYGALGAEYGRLRAGCPSFVSLGGRGRN